MRSKHTFFFNKDKIGNDGLPSHVRIQVRRETGLNETMLARYLAHSCVHSEYKINTHHYYEIVPKISSSYQVA